MLVSFESLLYLFYSWVFCGDFSLFLAVLNSVGHALPSVRWLLVLLLIGLRVLGLWCIVVYCVCFRFELVGLCVASFVILVWWINSVDI